MSQPIDRIKGLPVVGRYYFVPCMLSHEQWFPVIGPKHDDAEIIRVKREHWHYDWRFVDTRLLDLMIPRPKLREAQAGILYADRVQTGPVLKRRKCVRQMMEFPLEYRDAFNEMQPSPFAAELENAYASTTIKPGCRVCPHRGIPLNGLPADADGAVVCPGHGLKWNLNTGAMVRRVSNAVSKAGAK